MENTLCQVFERPDGLWATRKGSNKFCTVHGTPEAAIEKATKIVAKHGGGAIHILAPAGYVERVLQVQSPN